MKDRRKIIRLKQLAIRNFKGIATLDIDFGQVTDIFGDNGTGKTSVFDAFLWLMFGKDSSDAKTFSVKPLDSANNHLQRVDNEVSAALLVDNSLVVLKRVNREVWTKRRGSVTEEFTGNETLFYWNDVPMSAKDFQSKVAEICDENLFKLITSVNYFAALPWQKRRETLISMAGYISDVDVLANMLVESAFEPFRRELQTALQTKRLDEFKAEVSSKKKKQKEDKDSIPARVDEIRRAMPEAQDWTVIESSIAEDEAEIQSITKRLESVTAEQDAVSESARKRAANIAQMRLHQDRLKARITALRQADRIEFEKNASELKGKKTAAEQDLNLRMQAISSAEAVVNGLSLSLEQKNKARDAARTNFDEVYELTFTLAPGQDLCSHCGQKLPDTSIDVLRENFNLKKSESLASIKVFGLELKAACEKLEKDIAEQVQRIKNLMEKRDAAQETVAEIEQKIQEHANTLNAVRPENPEIITINQEISKIDEEVAAIEAQEVPEVNVALDELKQVRVTLTGRVNDARKLLANRETIQSLEKRRDELLRQEEAAARELVRLEGLEYVIEAFMKEKMEQVTASVNGYFSFVTFKLFESQINGGEKETCEILVNGVPYPDVNHASKINAGLDIINALSNYHGVSAPIFIDNRESVVNLIDTQAQIINLIVSASHKSLTVKS